MKALASTSLYDFFYQDHLFYITSSDSVGGRSIWLEVVAVGVVLTHPPSSRRRSRSSQLRPPAILPPCVTAPLRNPKTFYRKRRQLGWLPSKRPNLAFSDPLMSGWGGGGTGGVHKKEGHPLYGRGIIDEVCSMLHNLSLYGFLYVSADGRGILWGGNVTVYVSLHSV
jgi:hypothetical protein